MSTSALFHLWPAANSNYFLIDSSQLHYDSILYSNLGGKGCYDPAVCACVCVCLSVCVCNPRTSATPDVDFYAFLFHHLWPAALCPVTQTLKKPTGDWYPSFKGSALSLMAQRGFFCGHIVLLTPSPELKDTFRHRHTLGEGSSYLKVEGRRRKWGYPPKVCAARIDHLLSTVTHHVWCLFF